MNLEKFVDRLIAYGSDKFRDKNNNIILDFNKYVIFGVRGYSIQNENLIKNEDKINSYNDSLFVVKKTNKLECHSYPCTMDPGMTWLRKAMNPLGTARMEEGLYKYQIGIHRGHSALVQASRVVVRRYQEHKDGTPWISWEEEKPSIIQTGWFAIDIHAKTTVSEEVNVASAGCTVVDSVWEGAVWKDFFGLIQSAKNTQSFYYYCVLDQKTADQIVILT